MTELHPKQKIKIRILKKKLSRVTDKKKRKTLKAALRNQYNKSENTKPELQTKYILELMKLRYVQQFPLDGFIYDFILPDQRILIEVNGDFWHSSPLKYKKAILSVTQKKNHARDKRSLSVALKHGYRIIYIWEGDLKNKARKVKARLEKFIDNIETEKRSFHILEELFPQYRDFYLKNRNKKAIIIEEQKLDSVKESVSDTLQSGE